MIKQRIKRSRLWPWVAHWKGRQFERQYMRFREQYANTTGQVSFVPKPTDIQTTLQHKFAQRNWTIHPKKIGQVRTFALISSVSWHDALLPDLDVFGDVVRFDYHDLASHKPHQGQAYLDLRQRINDQLWEEIRAAHQKEPADWLFAYAQGNEILASLIKRIREELGIPCVTMCLDDKNSWGTEMLGEQWNGQRALANAFDLYWTSARVCCNWIAAEGGLPIYMPEGVATSLYYPQSKMEQDIDVSFLGACYGHRPQMIRALKEVGIPVTVFGSGWGDWGSYADDVVDVFRRSKINLGIGAADQSINITNVKGRDFEVPCTGGGVYLTQYNADLAQHFVIGQEISCYTNLIDMAEQIRFLLADSQKRAEMSHLARERCLKEHRWAHRYLTLLNMVGIVSPEAQLPAPQTLQS